jgi:acyl-CoA reductase-like NAD-dependent aldehyde dehydrogenase
VSVPELVSALAAALAALRVASPWQRGTAVGPLATAASADRVRAELAGAARRDALVIGAPAGAGLGDCYVAPTLVTGVAPDMDLFRQETFGPVLSVTEVAGLDAAIAAANATEYGLYGSVFTDDAEVLRHCAAAMNVSVLVRNAAPGRWDASLPVGGAVRTASGVGRVGGAYALDEVAETHSTQW